MIDISQLPQYIEEKRFGLLGKVLVENTTAKEVNLQTGIKGATALNLLYTDVQFNDGYGCGWNDTTTSTVSQRILTPGAVSVNATFCDKELLKTFMNYDVKVKAGLKNLPFEEDFTNGVVKAVSAALEKALWQGNTESSDANLNKFNGYLAVIDAADGVLEAQQVRYQADSTIVSRVNAVYAKLPSAVFTKGDVVMFMGSDDYRTYIQELIANGNLVITNALNDVEMPNSILIPGTNVRVYGVAGLDGTKRIVASYRDNFVYGVDMRGDEEVFDFWYSKDEREYRLAIEFVAGVQIAFPELVITGIPEGE